MQMEILNYINGEWRAASSGEQHANLNPARPDEILGYFPRSTADDHLTGSRTPP